MQISVRPLNSEAQWERCIAGTSPGALFQSWSWGDVQKKAGAAVSRYGVYMGSRLIGVFQTIDVRAKRGAFLHVRHGPVLSVQSKAVWRSVLSFLRAEARKRKMFFVRMNPLLDDTPETRERFSDLGLVPAEIHRMDGEYCWVLDLDADEDTILSDMRKSTRYEIRKAAKENAEVETTTELSDLPAFFELYRETSTRHGFVPHHGIREEFEIFRKHDGAVLYLGRHDGKLVSGAIILYYGNQAIYHHGASVRYPVPVSHAVQWRAIRDAKKRGMKVYNFWGIAPDDKPNHPWRGITVFKKGFGGHEMRYIHAHDLPVSPLYIIPRTIERIRRLSRGYD